MDKPLTKPGFASNWTSFVGVNRIGSASNDDSPADVPLTHSPPQDPNRATEPRPKDHRRSSIKEFECKPLPQVQPHHLEFPRRNPLSSWKSLTPPTKPPAHLSHIGGEKGHTSTITTLASGFAFGPLRQDEQRPQCQRGREERELCSRRHCSTQPPSECTTLALPSPHADTSTPARSRYGRSRSSSSGLRLRAAMAPA